MEAVKRAVEPHGEDNIMVAQINMSLNEVPQLRGYQYPMLALLRGFKDQGSQIYDGKWHPHDIEQFILKHV